MSGSNDLITLNGVSRVTIDGQHNNDGLKHLRFRNNTGYNSDITFVNGASKDTIINCYFESNTTFQYSATILFSTSNGVTGNTNIAISNCDIKNLDTINLPNYGIYSNGSIKPQDNNNNTISNCNINNFSFTGISLSNSGNGDNWTIKGNSFYYNIFTPVTSTQYGIDFEAGTTSNNNIISGNYIGGSAPNCKGKSWINKGGVTFKGIYLNAGIISATEIQNNIIQNINLTDSNSTFNGIYADGGSLVNIYKNIIGHPTVPNSIRSGLGDMYGIFNATAIAGGVYNINNNTIANIYSISGSHLIGIGNLNIFVNNPYESAKAKINIEGNYIYNISGSTSSTFNIFCGIDVIDSSIYNISGNSIHDLSTASVNGWNWGWGLSGIVLNSSSPGQTISQNSIYNLINTNADSVGLNVYGIIYSGPKVSSPTSKVIGNRIYNLTTSTSVSSNIFGIYEAWDNEGYGSFPGGCGDFVNNMISLGSNMNGFSHYIMGIYKAGIYNNNFYYNSVYIGGTQSAGSAFTSCYYNFATTTDNIINNIFYNACNNTGTSTAVHHAIIFNFDTTLVTNYNDYVATGTGGILSDVTDTLPFIKGHDAKSVIAAPVFVSATDLHLTGDNANSKDEGIGKDLSSNNPPYTVDIDGQPRTAHPDLGADQYYACATPILYNITGGGTFCGVSKGADICISGSQTGVNYQLQLNGNVSGSSIAGTGNQLCFGKQTAAGTYTVIATSCTSTTLGSVTITIYPIPVPTITGPTSICQGSPENVYRTEQGMLDYLWTISGGTIISGNVLDSVTVNWNVAGRQTICVNYTTPKGCKASSPTCKEITVNPLPKAPVADSATVIQQNQFTANWNSVADVTQYYLDVAYDVNFTNLVTGYNNKSVADVLSYIVTGLTANSNYYYRVRDYNGCLSDNSNTIKVTTSSEEGYKFSRSKPNKLYYLFNK